MDQSPLKRFWNAIKPPPAVPRRPAGREPDRDPSALARFWNAIKPPPAVHVKGHGLPKQQERRRRAMEEGAARSVELAQIFMHGKASGEQAAQEMARVVEDMRHIVGPSPEEAAFEKSAAARAFESGPPAPPSTSLWPEMIAAAEADYCRNRACDDATRKFFAALSAADPAKIYDPGKTDPLAAPTAGAPPSAPPSPH